jgi:hypothetical protein
VDDQRKLSRFCKPQPFWGFGVGVGAGATIMVLQHTSNTPLHCRDFLQLLPMRKTKKGAAVLTELL